MNLTRVKKGNPLVSNLSNIESISSLNRVCFYGAYYRPFTRSNYKYSCAVSGKYGSCVGLLPINRFVLLKKMTFSKLSFTSKKSW